ncbi:HTH La-type RNA-binding domain-containing protein [Trichonephila clavipes]|nr:HTH La-type RNA-binding domain-containing protein [Trichonephila clavipes]
MSLCFVISKIVQKKKFTGNSEKNELPTTLDELDTFISILYARGITGANKIELDSLRSVVWGPLFFRDTTARDKIQRTYEISAIRQKKNPPRFECLQTDNLCFISEVWKIFIENSIICSKLGPYITIDKKLFPSKARCRFTQYMLSKPDKFGIKFWLVAGINIKYVLNGFPYLGKYEELPVNLFLSE